MREVRVGLGGCECCAISSPLLTNCEVSADSTGRSRQNMNETVLKR